VSWTGLVLHNLLRNPRRTILTTASVAASVLLLATLFGAYRFISGPTRLDRSHLVLMVRPATSGMLPLPVSYRERIAALPGVSAVTPFNWVGVEYGGQDAQVHGFACDPGVILRIFSNWRLSLEETRAFIRDKTALIAGEETAARFGWKVGQSVTLRPLGGLPPLELVLRGIYTSDGMDAPLVFHWDYWNEIQRLRDSTTGFWVLASDPAALTGLMRGIDATFRNSPAQTKTETLKQIVLDFLGRLGNVKVMLLGISCAVLFTVLLIVANSMAMTIRERTAEIAVLRALGFRPHQVLGLLTAESFIITLVGSLIGSLGALGVFHAAVSFRIGGAMPVGLEFDLATAGFILAVATGVSLVSTWLPAKQVARLNIAVALRHTD
jgi:putative ABC transport system permease protein